MKFEFNANNNIIKLCMKGMLEGEKGNKEEASQSFKRAWDEASNEYERFISSYFIAKDQKEIRDRINWLEKSATYALRIEDEGVKSALRSLYLSIAISYEEVGDYEKSKENYDLSNECDSLPSDKGPFYHGTKADLRVGDLLITDRHSNYKPDLKMNHIYFTGLVSGAGLAAALAKGEGKERVYVVEPTGDYEHDPNVTDKRFPGNLSRSYRSKYPLRIIGELANWEKLSPEEIEKWHERIAKNKGEIIN